MWSQPLCGQHTVSYNHLHDLGTPRRELGDALSCIYTLGDNDGMEVENNLCHDVKAFNQGGFGLCSDHGSSRINFRKNVVMRTTGATLQVT